MASTVGEMSKDELREIIENTIEEKLLELLGDPDEGLTLKKSLQDRLMRQKKAVTQGERGELLDDVIRSLDLER